MISRRNIRIKVMQTLYEITTLEQNLSVENTVADRILDQKFEQILDVFCSCVLLLLKVAEFADHDAIQRSNRYLKTEGDQNVSIKIAHCLWVQKISGSKTFKKRLADKHPERFLNDDWVRKIYQLLVKSDEYVAYATSEVSRIEADLEIMKFIWESLVLTENGLSQQFSDDLPGWDDNGEIIIIMMQNLLKGTYKTDFDELLNQSKKEYAYDLLHTVIDKEAECLALIAPKLNNWDTERVALIDMIVLRMGICEFLFFQSIPTKVTINEYIDIAKLYSTSHSGQFVNGVLDNILKDMMREGRIQKDDRGNKEM